jgi:glutamyl-tRNA synthetase
MGWSMPDEREKFTLEEMIAHFDISRVSLGGPIFDVEKLAWLNSVWLREMDVPALLNAFQKWAINPEYLGPVVKQIQPRIQTLSDAAHWAGFFLSGMVSVTPESFAHKKLSPEDVRRLLQLALWELDAQRHWSHDTIAELFNRLAGWSGVKLRDLMHPFFVAIAGTPSSTPVMEAMVILGPDMTRARLRHAVSVLGAPSKKEAKDWEEQLKALKAFKFPESVDSPGGAA